MTSMTKISSILAATLVAALAATGCSSNSNNGAGSAEPGSPSASASGAAVEPSGSASAEASKEPITLKLMGPKQPIQGPWEQMDFFKEMETRTGIHFEFDNPPSTSFAEKKNLAFASGELPDVFFAAQLTASEEVTYGQQGSLIPLEDLIEEHAPNIKKLLDANPDIRKSITTTDGHIYSLPQVTELAHNLINKTWINGSWMKKVGVDQAPTTVDELYEMLKKFKEGDANGNGKDDEIPLSGSDIGAVRQSILPAFGLLTTDVQVNDGKVLYAATSEGYKQYLSFMNKLYKEQLLDNEIFSHTNEQFTAKGKSGQLGVFLAAAPFLVLDIKTDEDNFLNPTLPALTSEYNPNPVYMLNNGVQRGTFAITSHNKYPERTMEWVDYLYTVEGAALANSGIEGKGWKWLDDAHTTWDRIAVEGKNIEETRASNTPDPGNVIPTFKSKEFNYKINNPVTQWLHQSSEPYLSIARMAYPLVYFTDEEQKRLNVLTTDLNTYVSQMEAKFILSKDVNAGWDDYVSTINKMKVSELLDIYQAAYDRWSQSQ
ncbi:extracellular solute-binding protein [Cohnella fermenti]|uniref:Extracellular solute-binding protein n=1 Tax=Cohnella fermenti TaxID=2565925 RepID=A0A4S4CAK9_9BACL|nr:extracellular solute-binding protein [Cohnella fermenti]THF84478.1 extracellular solute-binding protein [Cohnella fermenti]